MSTLFLVGSVDLSEVEKANKLSHNGRTLFDRQVSLSDIDSLLLRLYQDRLDLSSGWNYETGISLVLYNGRASFKNNLNEIFKKFFPCFNIVAIDSGDGEGIGKFYSGLEEEVSVMQDRIKRMSHWMYYRPSKPCSSRMYSMMGHLLTVHRDGLQNRVPIPRTIRNIDFQSLVRKTLGKDDLFYWQNLSTWEFQAHNLAYTELIYCSFLLLKKLSADANAPISDNKLFLLLLTLESSYHQVNKFHNFKHAIDVMQATWQLCERLVDDPLQTLLLCMAAIGHDIGHPGSNNQLLCQFHSPIAENYENHSALENMHKDFLESILTQHWPQLLLINSSKKLNKANLDILTEAIMATDMALHEGYVKKLEHSPRNDVIDFATLLPLIIKAADISNVTRPLKISSQWACLITFEFAECAALQNFEEKKAYDLQDDLNCNISLLSPDKLVERFPSIPNGQIFFIENFAEQFFTEFCTRLPGLDFLIDNMETNKKFWLSKRQ